MDSNMVYQQNVPVQSIATIVLRALSNRLADTQPLMLKVVHALASVRLGTLVVSNDNLAFPEAKVS
jgi:hypothetical protein